MFELNFHQDQNKWRHELISIEVSKNESDRIIDSLVYKNHYAPTKKLPRLLGNHICNYVCRQCLKSYSCQIVLIKHKQQCGEHDIASLRLSKESHLYWKKPFHKNPI